jgi:hypothetical protein
MNGRSTDGEVTPEERLAAVFNSAVLRASKHGCEVDYADFRDELRPFVHKELLQARLDELRRLRMPHLMSAREAHLLEALGKIEQAIKLSKTVRA